MRVGLCSIRRSAEAFRGWEHGLLLKGRLLVGRCTVRRGRWSAVVRISGGSLRLDCGGRAVVATRDTRGVMTTRRRLVSCALLVRVVFSGLVTDSQIAHSLLDFIIGRTVVGIGVVCGGSVPWKICTSEIRGDRFGSARQNASGVVRRNRFGARQGSTAVIRGNGPLTRQCSARLVWRNGPLAGKLTSSVVWGDGSLTWELATSVVRRNWALAGKGSSTLVRGNGLLSWELPSCLIWRDGPWEVTRGRIWRHPSGSRSVLIRLVLGLSVTLAGFEKLPLFYPFTFATLLLAAGGVLLFAFATMLLLLALPIKSHRVNITTSRRKMMTDHSRSRSRSRVRSDPVGFQDCWNSWKQGVIDQPMKCSRSIVGS